MKTTMAWGFALALLVIGTTAQESHAQYALVEIQPTSSTYRISFDPTGDIVLNGQCYGGVNPLPAGEVITMFGNKAVAKNGNLYFAGTLNYNYSGTFPDGIQIRSGGTVLASITSQGNLYLRGTCGPYSGICSYTRYEPTKWNIPSVMPYNNCYNYGNDTITNTFAQPGYASGQMYSALTVDQVRAAALRDGLIWVGWTFPGNNYVCSGGGHLIYLAVAPGYDYHWWRLDKVEGTWSHKPGITQAIDIDHAGQPISNPLDANRGYYTDNGGFFCTCGGQANIR